MSSARLFITAAELVSPVGWGVLAHLDALQTERSFLKWENGFVQGKLPKEVRKALLEVADEKQHRHQDNLTQLSVLLARSLSGKTTISLESGVIFGSSRGPTELLEASFRSYQAGQRLPPLTSPTTTASSLPAAIARELDLSGPSLFVSAACSTGIHALIQAAATIRMGLAPSMIAGGAEFANTLFTLNMLMAAKVYAQGGADEYPCRPGAAERSGMVLSEGAAAVFLESYPASQPIGELIGWGAATEKATLTGISSDGTVLVKAIQSALNTAGLTADDIDLIVGHGAGTGKGDAAEMQAYRQIFAKPIPLVWHKWIFGHMLGASACASLILGLHHLREGWLPPHPYFSIGHAQRSARRLQRQRHLLVTALGFGGNAAAVIVKNPAFN